MTTDNPASGSARPCPAQHPDTAESCRYAYGHHGTLHRSAPGREWRQAVSVDFTAPSSPVADELDLDQIWREQSVHGDVIRGVVMGIDGNVRRLVAEVERLRSLVPSSSQTPAADDGLTETIHHAEPDEVDAGIDVLTPYDLASAVAVVDLVDRGQDASVDLPAESAGTPASMLRRVEFDIEPDDRVTTVAFAPAPEDDEADASWAAGTPAVPEAAYESAARAMLPWDEGMEAGVDLFAWHRCGSCPLKANEPCSCTGTPYPSAAVRAAIDAVWAAALSHVREETAAEIAQLRLDLETKTVWYGPIEPVDAEVVTDADV